MDKEIGFDAVAANRILDKQGRSQLWLAAELGMHKSTVNAYMTGKRKPPMHVIIAMAKILSVAEGSFARRAG
jgi:transcriptional regulator with XRE-family HTH domain